MGAMIGTRLGGADFRQLARLSLVGMGALLVGTTVGCLFALLVSWGLNLRLADVVMAYAPGAMEAMTIIAFALHLDPVFVGVHQLARFTFMSLVLPTATGFIQAYEERHGVKVSPEKPEEGLLRGLCAIVERQSEPLPHIHQRFGERVD